MGMDVSGRKPSSPVGEYFQASCWSWRPIQSLILELCSDLLDQKTLDSLGYNDGAGPNGQKVCTEMATRFENWMEHHTEGYQLELGAKVVDLGNGVGRFVSSEECAANPDLVTSSPHQISDDRLKEWIEFLRHCGGFQVF